MNLAEMVARCRYRFRDPVAIWATDAEWTQHLNAAMFEFLQAARWPFMLTFADHVMTAGDKSVELPPEQLEMFDNVYDVTHDRMLLNAPADGGRAGLPTRTRIFLEERPSTPVFFRVVGDRINVFPPCDVDTTLRVWYHESDPVPLADDADEPIFPERYHEAVVSGAIARAAADDENPNQVGMWRQEFVAVLQQAYRELSRFHSFEISPEFAPTG